MTKLLKTLCLFILSTSITFAQDIGKDANRLETKIEKFYSKTGVIIKYVDFKLSPIKLMYLSEAKSRIRKISSNSELTYFYQIEKVGSAGSSSIASIEYYDLLEVIKAFDRLKLELESDAKTNPDYLENKFTTPDGFQIGYLVEKTRILWFLKLETYGSDKVIFIKDHETLHNTLQEAKEKIEELKKK